FIYGTASGTSYTMNSAGAATFDVGNSSNSLANILGPLTVNGASDGDGDILNVYDQGNTAATAYTLTSTTLARSHAATITYSNVGITIEGGSGQNTYNVQATGAGTTIDTGSGNDTVDLGAANQLQGIQAPLTIV